MIGKRPEQHPGGGCRLGEVVDVQHDHAVRVVRGFEHDRAVRRRDEACLVATAGAGWGVSWGVGRRQPGLLGSKTADCD